MTSDSTPPHSPDAQGEQGPPGRSPDRSLMVDVNRTSLRVWEWGDVGAPMILASHGAFDHGRMLDGIASAMADRGWHVRALDLRGHGDSGPIDHGNTFHASILDIGLLAAASEKPVGLIGHSMGGSMSYNVAATWPEHISWVINFDGVGPPPEIFDQPPIDQAATQNVASTVKAFGRDRRIFADRTAMAAQRSAINRRVPARWMDHLVEHGTFENESGYSWKWHPLFATWLPNEFELDTATTDLAAVTCPVLMFTGNAEDDSWTFPKDQLSDRLRHLKDLEHVPVDDAGHYLHLERPEFVLAHIDSFLAGRAPVTPETASQ